MDANALGGHAQAHQELVWLAVAAVFVITLAVLGLLYRHLAGRAELEAAERVLDEDFAELEDSPSPPPRAPGDG